MQNLLTQDLSDNNFIKLTQNLKNILIIITALLSFILWFSSTILMPKRLEKVEETLSILNSRQSKMEVKTELIYQDMQSIKNNIYMNRSK